MMPEMSAATKEALAKARRLIPPMLDHFHKGQLGRVAVIGGSENYTGAPYFSAMASAKLGCDMSHVICTAPTAAVIKTYSPNLMVHPLMQESPHATHTAQYLANRVKDMLPRLHVLVIGPGLGRDSLMHETVGLVIKAARERKTPLVLDADALLIVGENPDLLHGYGLAVITPNVVEFKRLCDKLDVSAGGLSDIDGAIALSRRLAGPVVVRKGPRDVIADSRGCATVVDVPGGKKRSGGQGDTLTGAIGTMLAWRGAYHEGMWETETETEGQGKLGEGETVGLAAVAGCVVTREASRRAFERNGRSLQAGDLTEEVHGAFLGVFPGVDEGGGRSEGEIGVREV